MNIPTDPWVKIGLAESLIRQVVTRPTEWPADLRPEELDKLEGVMETLESLLRVSV